MPMDRALAITSRGRALPSVEDFVLPGHLAAMSFFSLVFAATPVPAVIRQASLADGTRNVSSSENLWPDSVRGLSANGLSSWGARTSVLFFLFLFLAVYALVDLTSIRVTLGPIRVNPFFFFHFSAAALDRCLTLYI